MIMNLYLTYLCVLQYDCYLMICLISNLIHMHYSARTHIPLASQLFLSPGSGWSRNIPRNLGDTMGLLPDTWTCGLRIHRECRERFPRHRLQRKLLVSNPGMQNGTCVAHVPRCMSGSLTHGGGVNVPYIPGACATRNLHIWQEAHGCCCPGEARDDINNLRHLRVEKL